MKDTNHEETQHYAWVSRAIEQYLDRYEPEVSGELRKLYEARLRISIIEHCPAPSSMTVRELEREAVINEVRNERDELRHECKRLKQSEREARGSEEDLRQMLDTYAGVEARAEKAEGSVSLWKQYHDDMKLSYENAWRGYCALEKRVIEQSQTLAVAITEIEKLTNRCDELIESQRLSELAFQEQFARAEKAESDYRTLVTRLNAAKGNEK